MNVRCPICSAGFRLPEQPPTVQARRLRLRCKRCSEEFVITIDGTGTAAEQAAMPAPRTQTIEAIVGPPPGYVPRPAQAPPVSAPLPVAPQGLGATEDSALFAPGHGAALGFGAAPAAAAPVSETPAARETLIDASARAPQQTLAMRPPSALDLMGGPGDDFGRPAKTRMLDELHALDSSGGLPGMSVLPLLDPGPPLRTPTLGTLAPAPGDSLFPASPPPERHGPGDLLFPASPQQQTPVTGSPRGADKGAGQRLGAIQLAQRPADARVENGALPGGMDLPPEVRDENAVSGLRSNDAMDFFSSQLGEMNPGPKQRDAVRQQPTDVAREVAARAIVQGMVDGPRVPQTEEAGPQQGLGWASDKIDPMYEFRDAFRELRKEDAAPSRNLMRLVEDDLPEVAAPSRFEQDLAQDALRDAVASGSRDTSEESALLNLALLRQERAQDAAPVPTSTVGMAAVHLPDVAISRGNSHLIQLDLEADRVRRQERDQAGAKRWLMTAVWMQVGVALWLGALFAHAGEVPRASQWPEATLAMVRAWGGETVPQVDVLLEADAPGAVRVMRTTGAWVPTSSGAWVLLVQGEVGNRGTTDVRGATVEVLARSPQGEVMRQVAVVGTLLQGADVDVLPQQFDEVMRLTHERVANFALPAGARAPFVAAYVIDAPQADWQLHAVVGLPGIGGTPLASNAMVFEEETEEPVAEASGEAVEVDGE